MHFESRFLHPDPQDLSTFLERFPPEEHDRGEVLIRRSRNGLPPLPSAPCVGYVVEGFVRGIRESGGTTPRSRRTAVVAGDGSWFGLEVFHHGENTYRYEAAAPTTASLIDLALFCSEAPRSVLMEVLASASSEWCTSAALHGTGAGTLRRRVLHLLHERARHHPRPELEMRQKDLADLMGVTRQTLHPVLKGLEAAGLVDLGYAEIVVADPGSLLAALEGEPG